MYLRTSTRGIDAGPFREGSPREGSMATALLPIVTLTDSPVQSSARSPFPVADRGQFIKQFTGPEEESRVVCFKFWQLVHASGCPFRCAYCFLQTTAFFR